jgi:hypothetical protein
MSDIMDFYQAQIAPTAPAAEAPAPAATPAPTSNISAVEAVGVENPVDNGKTGAENEAAKVAKEALESIAPPEATESAPPEQESIVEAPAAPQAPKQDSFAKRFAIQAQKEKELRARELEIQKKEVELRKIATPQAPLASNPLEGIDPKKQPLTALHKLGLSIQDVQEALLRGEKTPEVDPLAERLRPLESAAAELRALKEELARKDAENAQKTYEQQVSNVKQDIRNTASAEGYDLVASMGEFGVNTVFETMQQYYQSYEKVLTFKEACAIVEEHFEEDFLPKLVESKKVKAKITPPSSATPASERPAATPQVKPSAPTLTNKQSSQPNANPDPKTMSRDDYLDWLARNMVKHQ